MSQEKWLSVAARAALEEGAMMPSEAGGLSIALYNIAGEIYATNNICTHAFATLTDGCLDGDVIECRLHGGTFEVKTGKGLGALGAAFEIVGGPAVQQDRAALRDDSLYGGEIGSQPVDPFDGIAGRWRRSPASPFEWPALLGPGRHAAGKNR